LYPCLGAEIRGVYLARLGTDHLDLYLLHWQVETPISPAL